MPVQMGAIQINPAPPGAAQAFAGPQGPVPILPQQLQPIALPAAGQILATTSDAQQQIPLIRASYGLPAQTAMTVTSRPVQMPHTTATATAVTASNTQPMVSPGPPMLSPQQQMMAKAKAAGNASGYQNLMRGPGQQQQQQQQQPQFTVNYPPQSSAVPIQSQFQAAAQPFGYQQQQAIYPQQQQQQVYKASPMQQQQQQHKPSSQPTTPTPSMLQKQQQLLQQAQLKASSKTKSIFTKQQQQQSKPSSSFKVENESSPYAFDADPEPKNVPYRKTASPAKAAAAHKPKRKASTSSSSSSSKQQCSLEEAKEMGSSIPLPKELATQLAEQAKASAAATAASAATATPGGSGKKSEMTYFIPLQSSSGQSFGVAVKLGTEGPAGPNQKVN